MFCSVSPFLSFSNLCVALPLSTREMHPPSSEEVVHTLLLLLLLIVSASPNGSTTQACIYPNPCIFGSLACFVQLGSFDKVQHYFFPVWFAFISLSFVVLEFRKQYRRFFDKGVAKGCGCIELINEDYTPEDKKAMSRLMPRTEDVPIYTINEFNDKVRSLGVPMCTTGEIMGAVCFCFLGLMLDFVYKNMTGYSPKIFKLSPFPALRSRLLERF